MKIFFTTKLWTLVIVLLAHTSVTGLVPSQNDLRSRLKIVKNEYEELLRRADLYDKDYYRKGGKDLRLFSERRDGDAKQINYYLREGLNSSVTTVVSGHSGEAALSAVIFPAGNSSAALWWRNAGDYVELELRESPKAIDVSAPDSAKITERGVHFLLRANSSDLYLDYVVVGSVRDARDFETAKLKSADAQAEIQIVNVQTALISRRRLDGKGLYRARIHVVNGTLGKDPVGRLRLVSENREPLKIAVEAFTSEEPLHPVAALEIVTPAAFEKLSVTDIQALMCLSYEEKFLAGLWRYPTYFGRDQMMTAMLMEGLTAKAQEIVLGSVIERVAPNGQVAHEEDLGDKATRQNIAMGKGPTNEPVLDYKMVDNDELLPILLRKFAAQKTNGEMQHFMKRKTVSGRLYRDVLLANANFVLDRAKPFAERQVYTNLVSFKRGYAVGNWNDSNAGNGADGDAFEAATTSDERERIAYKGGRFAVDVNVALMPAALRSLEELFSLDKFALKDLSKAELARRYLKIWSTQVRPFFEVRVSPADAVVQAKAYATSLGLPVPPAPRGEIQFLALAINGWGRQIKVMNSNIGFDLFLNEPPESTVLNATENILTPYPLGLSTRVGMLIANPAFAGESGWKVFEPKRYHGAVIWAWQMALMDAGLKHQMARTDLSPSAHAKLILTHRALWESIRNVQDYLGSELWTWQVDTNGVMVPKPFAEGNDIQLWSQIFKTLQDPYLNPQGLPVRKAASMTKYH